MEAEGLLPESPALSTVGTLEDASSAGSVLVSPEMSGFSSDLPGATVCVFSETGTSVLLPLILSIFDLIVKIEVRAITQKANIRAIATLSFSFFRCA